MDESGKNPVDYLGDDEDIFDIRCRPSKPSDAEQVAFLISSLLDNVFADAFGPGGQKSQDILANALKNRLRHDCMWVMTEGETIIGVIDLESVETRRLNGHPLTRSLVAGLEINEKIESAGLLPILMHESAPDEAHQAIASILPGSRGEGRGTLLLMHAAFWSRAQGKSWMTTWLPEDNAFRPVYDRRGYFEERRVATNLAGEKIAWSFLKRPISASAYKILRKKEKE